MTWQERRRVGLDNATTYGPPAAASPRSHLVVVVVVAAPLGAEGRRAGDEARGVLAGVGAAASANKCAAIPSRHHRPPPAPRTH